jgi:hypothetical protein
MGTICNDIGDTIKKQTAIFWITLILIFGFRANVEEPRTWAEDTISGLGVPVSRAELMEKVTQALESSGHEVASLQTISLGELGRVYVATVDNGRKKVFARVVARRVPCMDCHDVFFVYSFDQKMKFIDFIALHISKRYNKPWDSDDIARIRNRFSGQSLSEALSFNPMVDAISSATISSKLVFQSIGQTDRVFQELAKRGIISD